MTPNTYQGDPRFLSILHTVETMFREKDPRVYALFRHIEALHVSKGNDYADVKDHFMNVRQSEEFGVPPWVGAMIRGNDKMMRIKNAASGKGLRHESVTNSIIDLAAYCVIALALFFEEKGIEDVDEIIKNL